MSRRAKIVATIGPASHDRETIRQLIVAGMDVARLNFSHGTHDSHAQAIRMLRQAAEQFPGTEKRISVDYPDLPRSVGAGRCILLDDGKLELQV